MAPLFNIFFRIRPTRSNCFHLIVQSRPPSREILHIKVNDNSNTFLSKFTHDKTGVATFNIRITFPFPPRHGSLFIKRGILPRIS